MNRFTAVLLLVILPTATQAADITQSRRTAIVTAVEAVLPATVTIGAEKVAIREVNPFRRFHDDFFSDWFAAPFFGGYREAVRVKSLGSGVLIGKSGLVLTNDHVVADAEDIHVTLSDGRVFPARLKGRGLPLDLALLEIDQPSGKAVELPYVTLGMSDDLALGEWAIAIGAPSNLEASVTAGVISAVGRRLPAKQDYSYLGMIQTDASINPGNSGGPLVNADGKVVGINTVIITQTGGSVGLGFAIPAEQARKVIEDLMAIGEVQLAYFGWEVSDADKSADAGVAIDAVHDGTDAAAAGIQKGARIRAINGKPIRATEDYEQALLSIRIGQSVAVRVMQDDREQVHRLTARLMPESMLRVDLGLVVENVSARYRRALGGGVVVTEIRPDGFLGRKSSGIRPGDIILAVNGKKIESVEDYESLTRRLRKKTPLEITFRRQNVIYTFSIQL